MGWYHCLAADVCGDEREEVVLSAPYGDAVYIYTAAPLATEHNKHWDLQSERRVGADCQPYGDALPGQTRLAYQAHRAPAPQSQAPDVRPAGLLCVPEWSFVEIHPEGVGPRSQQSLAMAPKGFDALPDDCVR